MAHSHYHAKSSARKFGGTKRPSIRAAVEWIAFNDEPNARDVEEIAGFISTLLVADLFGVPATEVARRVVHIREAGI